jgi:hypothetical protein
MIKESVSNNLLTSPSVTKFAQNSVENDEF